VKIEILSVSPPVRKLVLAHISIRLTIQPCMGSELVLVLHDIVVMRDDLGGYRVRMPRYEVSKGRGAPAVLISSPVKQAIEQAVTEAFVRWQKERTQQTATTNADQSQDAPRQKGAR
jgi:hypothetical protein